MSPFAPPFASFVAPARRSAELWRTGVGLCLIALIYAGAVFAMLNGAQALWPELDMFGDRPIAALIFLSTFLGMAIAPILVVRWLHRRSWQSLFGYGPRVLHDFVLGAGAAAAVFVVNIALWSVAFDGVPNLDWSLWLSLLPLILMLVLIQTGAEELVFRGYLQQQLAARFASPLAWLIVPSLLFAFAHYDPEAFGPNLWPMLAAIGIFALVAGDLTARTGNIGAAWGVHFANNIIALTVIAIDGPLTGLALFTTPYSSTDPGLTWLILADAVTVFIIWMLLRRLVQR